MENNNVRIVGKMEYRYVQRIAEKAADPNCVRCDGDGLSPFFDFPSNREVEIICECINLESLDI